MGSSFPLPPPSFLPNKIRFDSPIRSPWNPSLPSRTERQRRYCSLTSYLEGKIEASWIQAEGNSHEDYGGWSVRKPEIADKNVIPKLLLAGVGSSMAILIATFTYFSFSRKGFKFRFNASFHTLHEMLMPSESTKVPVEVTKSTALEVKQASETRMEEKPDMASVALKPKENHVPALGESRRIIVPVAADPTQKEALCVLKKLKIIENDASADELCTRREYARWFVKANSMLERNLKHRISPMILLAGSILTAFDDVSVNDPDFWFIQALGEAGIVLSKLSTDSNFSDMGNSDGPGRFDFSPESLISRFDLVNWKAMLEYLVTPETKEKMSRTKVGVLDLSASSIDASPQLLMDLMAGDKSITRRVFGNIRRLQPQKPVTIAQAAVALISGTMAEAIRSELSILEAENRSRLAEIDEIRSELVRREEIQRFWEEQLNKEKEHGFEVESDFQLALLDLEEEKVARDKWLSDYMKEKAALDCQQQLLSSLKKEADGMSDRLATERAIFLSEKQSLEKLFADLRDLQDAVNEAKSILEAEKEALRILRCWVEEEARRIHARAKNLKQAAQRWKWSNESSNSQNTARNQ